MLTTVPSFSTFWYELIRPLMVSRGLKASQSKLNWVLSVGGVIGAAVSLGVGVSSVMFPWDAIKQCNGVKTHAFNNSPSCSPRGQSPRSSSPSFLALAGSLVTMQRCFSASDGKVSKLGP